jgi:hypothetical protein
VRPTCSIENDQSGKPALGKEPGRLDRLGIYGHEGERLGDIPRSHTPRAYSRPPAMPINLGGQAARPSSQRKLVCDPPSALVMSPLPLSALELRARLAMPVRA